MSHEDPKDWQRYSSEPKVDPTEDFDEGRKFRLKQMQEESDQWERDNRVEDETTRELREEAADSIYWAEVDGEDFSDEF